MKEQKKTKNVQIKKYKKSSRSNNLIYSNNAIMNKSLESGEMDFSKIQLDLRNLDNVDHIPEEKDLPLHIIKSLDCNEKSILSDLISIKNDDKFIG